MWIVGGDYFCLLWDKKNNKRFLDYYLDQFNIDDYWIYKRSGKQRLVDKEEMLSFKNVGYIFFKKEKYNKEHIDEWIGYFNDFGGIQFLDKPLPPFSPQKIIIKK
jgi:hypothetical protein